MVKHSRASYPIYASVTVENTAPNNLTICSQYNLDAYLLFILHVIFADTCYKLLLINRPLLSKVRPCSSGKTCSYLFDSMTSPVKKDRGENKQNVLFSYADIYMYVYKTFNSIGLCIGAEHTKS